MTLGLGTSSSAQRPVLELRGSMMGGNLIVGRTAPGSRVRVANADVRVSRRGVFLFALAPDQTGRVAVSVRTRDGDREHRELEVSARTYPTRRLDDVPEELVTPDGELAAEERAFQARFREAALHDGEDPHFEAGFTWPVQAAITSPFGAQRIMHGTRQRHVGVDLAVPVGHAVRAPGDGVVTLVATGPVFGHTLVIDHGHGLTSALLHLSRAHVGLGDRVRRGDVVASSGRSGRVSGPHLDVRTQLLGVPVDPASVIAGLPPRR
ncbi:MAG: M23 family metallopeptidase [Sandaracinaceae bacterium]